MGRSDTPLTGGGGNLTEATGGGGGGGDLLSTNNLSDVTNENTALNNLLPAQSGKANYLLKSNGTDSSWLNPLVVGIGNISVGSTATAIGINNIAAAINDQVYGEYNFTNATSYASVVIGLLNNQQGGTLDDATGVITGSPVAATTIGLLGVAVGIRNLINGDRKAVAIGIQNTASGVYASIALGYNNQSLYAYSSALGVSNTTGDQYSLAVGYHNTASGYTSNAVGIFNTTNGRLSSAFGALNITNALNNHVFGGYNFTNATSYASVAIGLMNNQKNGTLNTTTGVITGSPVAADTIGRLSIAVGIKNNVIGTFNVGLGYSNTTGGADSCVAVGVVNSVNGQFAVGVGTFNTTLGQGTSALGVGNTTGSSYDSTAVGRSNNSTGIGSTAVGFTNTASANYASAFGSNITNSVANSAELGADNTNKLHTDATGLQFKGYYLPQILSRTSGIDGKTVAATTLFTVPTGKSVVITQVIVRVTTASSISSGPTARVIVQAGGVILASLAMTGMTSTTIATSMINDDVTFTLATTGQVIQLDITSGATATTATLEVDLIGYLI